VTPCCGICSVILCISCQQSPATDSLWCEPCSAYIAAESALALEIEEEIHGPLPPPGPPKAGARWLAEEDARLVSEFRGKEASRAIAEVHGRSEGAVWSRLVHLREVNPDAVPQRFQRSR